MEKIRGYIYFYGTLKDDLNIKGENSFKEAKFNNLHGNNKDISGSGVFISGEVDVDLSAQELIDNYTKQLGQVSQKSYCDISLSSEDEIIVIKKGKLSGHYTSIRVLPPYTLDVIENIAKKIGEITNAHDIMLRTAEPIESSNQNVICIDIIMNETFNKYKQEIEELINHNNLSLGTYTHISLG